MHAPHLFVSQRNYYTDFWIGFTQLGYSGLEGDFVRPVVKILSGRIAPGLTAAVHFQTAYIQATGEFPMYTKVLKSNNFSFTIYSAF